MKYSLILVVATFLMLQSFCAKALTFPLPSPSDSVVGQLQWTQSMPGDTFSSIGRRYDIGYYELVEANPTIDPEHPPVGSIIVIPSRFILPPVPRTGIVINLAELRVYYYLPGQVETFPVGIGRQGWMTPLGLNRITQKMPNPTWFVPDSIRADRAKDRVILPKFVLPGPNNPLGSYAMRLSEPTYLLHGTNDYTGVGRRSSSGCIRMLPEDIEVLFSQVKIGTPVNIISTAFKAGWLHNQLYLEAHVPLQEQQLLRSGVDINNLRQIISAQNPQDLSINWTEAMRIATEQNGIPQKIGITS